MPEPFDTTMRLNLAGRLYEVEPAHDMTAREMFYLWTFVQRLSAGGDWEPGDVFLWLKKHKVLRHLKPIVEGKLG
jgi:hypothetical protein